MSDLETGSLYLHQNGRLLQRLGTDVLVFLNFWKILLILQNQTLLSVTPKLPLCAFSGVKWGKFSKTRTSLLNFWAKQIDNITLNFWEQSWILHGVLWKYNKYLMILAGFWYRLSPQRHNAKLFDILNGTDWIEIDSVEPNFCWEVWG